MEEEGGDNLSVENCFQYNCEQLSASLEDRAVGMSNIPVVSLEDRARARTKINSFSEFFPNVPVVPPVVELGLTAMPILGKAMATPMTVPLEKKEEVAPRKSRWDKKSPSKGQQDEAHKATSKYLVENYLNAPNIPPEFTSDTKEETDLAQEKAEEKTDKKAEKKTQDMSRQWGRKFTRTDLDDPCSRTKEYVEHDPFNITSWACIQENKDLHYEVQLLKSMLETERKQFQFLQREYQDFVFGHCSDIANFDTILKNQGISKEARNKIQDSC